MTDGRRGRDANEVEVLRSACEESRAVLNDQLTELSDIGDKALWTVRTSMIVLGVVVSAASLGDANTLRRLHPGIQFLAAGGIALVLAASVYGLGTYFVADRVRGVGPNYRHRARDGLSEREWRRALLDGYGKWTTEMEVITSYYGAHLFRAQTVLVSGVFVLVLAAVLSIWTL
ncbi:hypothetical protein [Halobacterium litoreum]|uniref:Uncharacterized protein n=1 Tax=Halobacterium litoreum TaxID=2039234 RepID=A0ABD5NDT0_9EURY|nr:hypothetical protein [Halobacterium litoreum]UHH13807.1 hypothetical protein LT972_02145 [Halobacterium litoreum]